MEASTTAARRHCFVDGEGLASIVEMESAGFSGSHLSHHHPLVSRKVVPRRRGSIRNIGSLSSSGFSVATAGYGCLSPRMNRVYDSRFEEVNHPPHFLESCFLCKKPLSNNRDIFMYRGDTPFCSEECRQEQIESDEAKEKKWNLSASMKAMRSKKNDSTSQRTSSSSSYRAGTVAAA